MILCISGIYHTAEKTLDMLCMLLFIGSDVVLGIACALCAIHFCA